MAETTQKPRADAVENRRRLVTAAGRALRSGGVDFSMRSVAKDAGVGIATAYRHFPSKTALLEQVFAAQVSACSAMLDRAASDPDPGNAIRDVIACFADMQVEQPGLLRSLLTATGRDAPFVALRAQHSAALAMIVARAEAAGAIRSGTTVHDVRVGLMAMTAFAGDHDGPDRPPVLTLRDLLLRALNP
ncbi:TetR/AcrR family transcriptional regulator [Gryllotalpicola reticulitermitis]|uniref:TetR/AcrR family transcriptional regulator n=1 Tax=Gryllotalpicola reticulitermitis TaxID=1184153 RepID=A0ABV8QAS0_9MICO